MRKGRRKHKQARPQRRCWNCFHRTLRKGLVLVIELDLLRPVLALVVQGDSITLEHSIALRRLLQGSTSKMATTSKDPPTSNPVNPAKVSSQCDQGRALEISDNCLKSAGLSRFSKRVYTGKERWLSVTQALASALNRSTCLYSTVRST